VKRWPFYHFLVILVIFSTVALAGCGSFEINPSTILTSSPSQDLGDAAFRVIDLVLNSEDIFTVAQDTFLLSKDAINLVTTLNANQTPPTNTKSGYIQVSILYNKRGVESQDVYNIKTGKASLGILLEGGTTFESFSGNSVDIDATHTHKITIVPLQNATSQFTVSANHGWQNTGIFLKRGKQFKVKYLSGTWTISKGVVQTSDAGGQPVNAPPNIICNCGEPLGGYSTQGLVGRVGGGVGYAPLQVGDDFSGISYDNDFLALRMNLADQLLSYSSGSITVSIETNNS
jgi:hypothetical protein